MGKTDQEKVLNQPNEYHRDRVGGIEKQKQ